mmetsp:Transcript_4606/g.9321  ORF Transcript_4606/g.9321 Transcript_4606/m.9321 type:complete len:100 (-) Transcript_4606:942-1241(-)
MVDIITWNFLLFCYCFENKDENIPIYNSLDFMLVESLIFSTKHFAYVKIYRTHPAGLIPFDSSHPIREQQRNGRLVLHLSINIMKLSICCCVWYRFSHH